MKTLDQWVVVLGEGVQRHWTYYTRSLALSKCMQRKEKGQANLLTGQTDSTGNLGNAALSPSQVEGVRGTHISK